MASVFHELITGITPDERPETETITVIENKTMKRVSLADATREAKARPKQARKEAKIAKDAVNAAKKEAKRAALPNVEAGVEVDNQADAEPIPELATLPLTGDHEGTSSRQALAFMNFNPT